MEFRIACPNEILATRAQCLGETFEVSVEC